MDDQDERLPGSGLTLSLLISESVYRLITIVERVIRWFMRNIFRPYLFLFRCLVW